MGSWTRKTVEGPSLAIRQADHFHAELIQTLGANDELRREVDDLRKQLHEAEAQVAQPDRPEPVDPASGAGLIAAERARQITDEEYTPEHDDRHDDGQLLQAAATYVLEDFAMWPWSGAPKFTSSSRIRELVKAGALIAAEIDRLQRPEPEPDEAAVEVLAALIRELDEHDKGSVALAEDLVRRGVQVPEAHPDHDTERYQA